MSERLSNHEPKRKMCVVRHSVPKRIMRVLRRCLNHQHVFGKYLGTSTKTHQMVSPLSPRYFWQVFGHVKKKTPDDEPPRAETPPAHQQRTSPAAALPCCSPRQFFPTGTPPRGVHDLDVCSAAAACLSPQHEHAVHADFSAAVDHLHTNPNESTARVAEACSCTHSTADHPTYLSTNSTPTLTLKKKAPCPHALVTERLAH